MIDVQQLGKLFEGKRGPVDALQRVSFRCEPGRIFGLLGVNGAGKTTCLRLLATLLQPTSGRATVNGFDIIDEPQKVRASIGFLSTATALYGRMTALEVVEYFGRLHGMEEKALQARIDLVFDRLEMNEFRNRRCDKLSTGMKQKTSIARTLVHDPPVMVFDEPTNGLDVLTSRNVLQFIRECGARGKTVLYSTHIMTEAERLCDTIAILHQGRLLAEGSLAQLREKTGLSSLEDIFVKTVEEHE